mmetsp:Transcript_107180/g.181053  ORF Transcript_107180/g.181053 Transcript_107180/m.181053 type:complete len:389 (-) Transcript_107180:2748-3914(-)
MQILLLLPIDLQHHRVLSVAKDLEIYLPCPLALVCALGLELVTLVTQLHVDDGPFHEVVVREGLGVIHGLPLAHQLLYVTGQPVLLPDLPFHRGHSVTGQEVHRVHQPLEVLDLAGDHLCFLLPFAILACLGLLLILAVLDHNLQSVRRSVLNHHVVVEGVSGQYAEGQCLAGSSPFVVHPNDCALMSDAVLILMVDSPARVTIGLIALPTEVHRRPPVALVTCAQLLRQRDDFALCGHRLRWDDFKGIERHFSVPEHQMDHVGAHRVRRADDFVHPFCLISSRCDLHCWLVHDWLPHIRRVYSFGGGFVCSVLRCGLLVGDISRLCTCPRGIKPSREVFVGLFAVEYGVAVLVPHREQHLQSLATAAGLPFSGMRIGQQLTGLRMHH